jgi:hypothetical protein
MAEPQRRYVAYLLRLWQEQSAEEPVWRASLKDPHSGVRTGFPDLKRLYAFLKEQTETGDVEER